MSTVRVKNQRMTKQELHDFVKWVFTHVNDDGWDALSNYKIAKLYNQETGKHINHVTVSNNRGCWYIKGGELVRCR